MLQLFFSFIKLIVNIFIRTYKLNLLKSERYEQMNAFYFVVTFHEPFKLKKNKVDIKVQQEKSVNRFS
jgi:hypothetical protein